MFMTGVLCTVYGAQVYLKLEKNKVHVSDRRLKVQSKRKSTEK